MPSWDPLDRLVSSVHIEPNSFTVCQYGGIRIYLSAKYIIICYVDGIQTNSKPSVSIARRADSCRALWMDSVLLTSCTTSRPMTIQSDPVMNVNNN